MNGNTLSSLTAVDITRPTYTITITQNLSAKLFAKSLRNEAR